MDIYDFNILTNKDKYYNVFTKGQFVNIVAQADIKYVLYSLSNLWLEVQYHSPRNKIKSIDYFVKGKIRPHSLVSFPRGKILGGILG